MADSPTVCPFCNDSILIPEEFFGSEVECPTCHKQFFIPKVTEEENSEDLESANVGTFECPTCGATNTLPKDFAGKFKCQGCQKEIEVINDDTILCPHCGKSISRKDTTCIHCQRAINEPAATEKEVSAKPEQMPMKKTLPNIPEDQLGDEEDQEVFYIITKLKSINLIAYFIILIVCIAVAAVCIVNKEYASASPFMGIILLATLWTIVFHLLLSWFRGIYKNLVRIRIAAEKMTDLKK